MAEMVNMTSMKVSETPVSVGIHNIEVTVIAELTGASERHQTM